MLFSRRDFLKTIGVSSALAAASSLTSGDPATSITESGETATRANGKGKLFPTDLEERKWLEFSAAGYNKPVSGAIFRASQYPCCGMPGGGLDTGCIDIDVRGAYGFSSIFNPVSDCPVVKGWRMPRKSPSMAPLL